LAVYVSAQLPADALSAVEIQDHCQIDMLMQQLNVCDIRSPNLVQSGYLCAFQKVWIYRQAMIGISCHRLEFLLQAQKVIPSHQSQHAFAVNCITAVLEFSRNPPVTIARKFQGDLLKLVLQIHILRVCRSYLRLCPPFVVAAATYFECLAGLRY